MNKFIHSLPLALICWVLAGFVGLEAAEAPDESKIAALVRQLGDEEFSARKEAQEELIKLGEPVEKPLQAFRNDPDPEVRRRIQEIFDHFASLRRELKWADPKLEGKAEYISKNSGKGMRLTFRNHLKKPVRIFWIDTDGERQAWRGLLKSGDSVVCERSYIGHVWMITDADGNPLGLYKIDLEEAVLAVRAPLEAGRQL